MIKFGDYVAIKNNPFYEEVTGIVVGYKTNYRSDYREIHPDSDRDLIYYTVKIEAYPSGFYECEISELNLVKIDVVLPPRRRVKR